jgi:hypothetical protein
MARAGSVFSRLLFLFSSATWSRRQRRAVWPIALLFFCDRLTWGSRWVHLLAAALDVLDVLCFTALVGFATCGSSALLYMLFDSWWGLLAARSLPTASGVGCI